MLTVYGDIRSGNCLKVKWLLDWLMRDYRWVEIDVMSGVTRCTEFLVRNPAGQVPTVVLDDDRELAQSNAIIGYFGEGPTLADLALVAYTRVAHEGDFDLSTYPAVRGWIGRVEAAFAIS